MHVFMLKKYTYLLSPLLLALFIMSCHSDIGEVNPNTEQTNQITVPLVFEEVEGDLIGYVFDDSNDPIAGANVSIYSGETITNEFGVFTFEKVKIDLQGTFIKVEKDGYMLGSDLVYPNANGKGTARIMMLKILDEPVFDASDGGVVQIQGGGTITFPPSSLTRPNGSIYDGKVKTTAYRISPSDPDFGNQMSGALLGKDLEGRHRVLSTYGILALELRGFDNQKLRIKSDKVAELSFPIEDELQSFVGSEIPAWNFDFQDGLWYEKVITSNDKQNFTTSINVPGYWNIALPNAISQVCGKLIYNNQLPAKNYVVQIIYNNLPSRIGITDQDGYFCGKIPFGENLKFQVLHPVCGEILKDLAIDPFEEVGTIGDVILEVEEKYISGTIECGGELIDNSTIIIESNGTTNIFYPDADGAFSINLDAILCGSTSSYTLFAYDNATEVTSELQELTAEYSETLRLEVCSTECLAQAIFEYEKEDYCSDGAYNRVYIGIANGSGEYTYEWQDGSTGNFLNDPSPGSEVCVMVMDEVNNCEYTFCDEVLSYKRLGIESIYSSNTECQMASGFVTIEVIGGKEPLQYEWKGPEGYVSSEAQIEGLSPGIYTLTIQDGGGCEATETSVVYDVTTPIQFAIEDLCEQSVITIEEDEGYKPYVYNWDAGMAVANQLYVHSPGVYTLTITDANSCTRRTSITLSQAGLLPIINPIYECEIGTLTFSELQSGFDYYYQSFGSNDKIPLDLVQGKIEVLILEAGYRFDLGSENSFSGNCSTAELVELPRFEGLEIGAVTPVSCESCSDGSIEFNVNIDEDCIDCSPGEVIVTRIEDGMDVTDLNIEKQLERGEYYVIVLDDNTGCYIAHSLVVVE